MPKIETPTSTHYKNAVLMPEPPNCKMWKPQLDGLYGLSDSFTILMWVHLAV